MSEPDVEKVEHRPSAPLRPGMSPLLSQDPKKDRLTQEADDPSYFSSDSTTPPSTEHGGSDKGRKAAAGVPGAEKTDDDGRIIHSWNGPDDPENPFNWAPWYKWVLTVTVCFVSILTGLPAGSYGVGASYYSSQFNILTAPFDNSIWATVSWNIGAAVWPLIFVPLTEAKGRMPGYVPSPRLCAVESESCTDKIPSFRYFGAYIIFVAFLFGSAFAQNYATLIVTRFVRDLPHHSNNNPY